MKKLSLLLLMAGVVIVTTGCLDDTWVALARGGKPDLELIHTEVERQNGYAFFCGPDGNLHFEHWMGDLGKDRLRREIVLPLEKVECSPKDEPTIQ